MTFSRDITDPEQVNDCHSITNASRGGDVMTHLRVMLCCFIVGGLLALPGLGDAFNSQVYFVAGAVAPKSAHESIRMDSEQVTIRLRRTAYTVDAVFRLFNTGKTTKEWVGLPYRGWGYDTDISGSWGFLRFGAWADGRKVEFSPAHEVYGTTALFPLRLPPHSQSKLTFVWMVRHITFPGHARKTIRVRYEAPYIRYEKSGGHGQGDYLHGSSSLWKGTIGKAVFIVDCTEVGGTKNIKVMGFGPSSGTRVLSDNVWKYEAKDIKPSLRARLRICYTDKEPQPATRSAVSPKRRKKDSKYQWGK